MSTKEARDSVRWEIACKTIGECAKSIGLMAPGDYFFMYGDRQAKIDERIKVIEGCIEVLNGLREGCD